AARDGRRQHGDLIVDRLAVAARIEYRTRRVPRRAVVRRTREIRRPCARDHGPVPCCIDIPIVVAVGSDRFLVVENLAAVDDQRSCCHTPIRLFGFTRSTAIIGSTSAPLKRTPVIGVWSQPAANGDAAVTRTRESPIFAFCLHIATPSVPYPSGR